MKIKRSIVRSKSDTNGVWGDLVISDHINVDKELRRSISRRIFLATSLVLAVILSCFWFWVNRIDSAQARIPAVVESTRDSVVSVGCKDNGGTGVAMDIQIPPGHKSAILSAAHVFDDCKVGEKVLVNYQGQDHTGLLVKKDPDGPVKDPEKESDIALIYVDFFIPGLKPAPTANVGDWAIVVGDPFDHTNYVTFGIITEVEHGQYATDAAVNHGNSGGPMFDSSGKVLGIVSWSETHSNQHELNPRGIYDDAVGISYAKRLKLACRNIFSSAPSCPFSE